jgi:HTH-type transcriptional regulator / antitoxin HipB
MGCFFSYIPDREYKGQWRPIFPSGNIMARFLTIFPTGNIWPMKSGNLPIGNMAMTIKNAAEFGALIRQRRRKLGLTQDELAARCGVGLRFIIELEAGKPSCQLGKALTAAVEVGLHLEDVPPARTSGIGVSAATTEDDPLSQIPSY